MPLASARSRTHPALRSGSAPMDTVTYARASAIACGQAIYLRRRFLRRVLEELHLRHRERRVDECLVDRAPIERVRRQISAHRKGCGSMAFLLSHRAPPKRAQSAADGGSEGNLRRASRWAPLP
jgi:hypothetical protein